MSKMQLSVILQRTEFHRYFLYISILDMSPGSACSIVMAALLCKSSTEINHHLHGNTSTIVRVCTWRAPQTHLVKVKEGGGERKAKKHTNHPIIQTKQITAKDKHLPTLREEAHLLPQDPAHQRNLILICFESTRSVFVKCHKCSIMICNMIHPSLWERCLPILVILI